MDSNQTPGVIPEISVVIIARNEQEMIQRCIESVFAQSVRVSEIIVVDGNSTDHTRQVVKELARRRGKISLIVEDRDATENGPAAARNLGASSVTASQGNLLLFLNGDVSIGPDYLSKLLLAMESSGLDAVAGLRWNVRNSLVNGLMNVHYALNYNTSHRALSAPVFLSGDAMLIRAEAFWSVGGYDPTMPAGEDADLGYRLRGEGRKIAYCADATIWHEGKHYRTVADWVKQLAWYGRGAAALANAHDWRMARERDGLQRNVFTPFSMLLAFVLLFVIAASTASPVLWGIVGVGIGAGAVRYLRAVRTIRRKCGSTQLPTSPLVVDFIIYPLFRLTRYGLLSLFTWRSLHIARAGDHREQTGNRTL